MFTYVWVIYLFSWFGAIYDLTVVFFLLNRKTRPFAYAAVVLFHVMTAILFPIGVFPYIMILSTLIFFPASFHHKVLRSLNRIIKTIIPGSVKSESGTSLQNWNLTDGSFGKKVVQSLLTVFVLIQLLFPWRYLLYPDSLFWNEEGYRFSWRVMLMEKTGYTTFRVEDPETGRWSEVNSSEYLTPLQEKIMSTQPDMILQFAQFLDEEYRKKGISDPVVKASSYVALNGRSSRPFIDRTVDLSKEKESFKHKDWILPFRSGKREYASSY